MLGSDVHSDVSSEGGENNSSLNSSLNTGLELGIESNDEEDGLNLNLWTGLMLDTAYNVHERDDSIIEP
jgi:hypothetical protein